MKSESDQRLLELLSEGKVDAEIAIRLGISTEDAKRRIDNLMKATGASTRADLLRLQQAPARPPWSARRARLLAGGLAAVGLVIVVGGWWRSQDSPHRAAPTTNEPTTTLPPSSVPPPSPNSSGSIMMPLGQFITASPASATPLSQIESRDTMVVATVVDGAMIAPPAGDPTWSVASRTSEGATFTTRNGFQLFIYLRVEGGGRLSPLGSGVLVQDLKDGQPITVLMWASLSEGGKEWTTRIELGNDGAIWVDPEPVSPSTPVVFSTGELLKVDQTTWKSRIFTDASLRVSTRCADVDRPCVIDVADEVIFRNRHLIPAPMAGTLFCRQDGTFQLESDFSWIFALTDAEGDRSGGCFEVPTRQVVAGEPMFDWKYFSVSVTGKDGTPASIISGQDGTIWVGPIFPTVGCPCR